MFNYEFKPTNQYPCAFCARFFKKNVPLLAGNADSCRNAQNA